MKITPCKAKTKFVLMYIVTWLFVELARLFLSHKTPEEGLRTEILLLILVCIKFYQRTSLTPIIVNECIIM